mmetsp:Transcript_82742/g.230740  ORF Transcript_82742/g.230740 Transcript_82742/m.230740 type:complete len:222 (+) Transcript_82742:1485-2150(+)
MQALQPVVCRWHLLASMFMIHMLPKPRRGLQNVSWSLRPLSPSSRESTGSCQRTCMAALRTHAAKARRQASSCIGPRTRSATHGPSRRPCLGQSRATRRRALSRRVSSSRRADSWLGRRCRTNCTVAAGTQPMRSPRSSSSARRSLAQLHCSWHWAGPTDWITFCAITSHQDPLDVHCGGHSRCCLLQDRDTRNSFSERHPLLRIDVLPVMISRAPTHLMG